LREHLQRDKELARPIDHVSMASERRTSGEGTVSSAPNCSVT
jgi:hypothetical protein